MERSVDTNLRSRDAAWILVTGDVLRNPRISHANHPPVGIHNVAPSWVLEFTAPPRRERFPLAFALTADWVATSGIGDGAQNTVRLGRPNTRGLSAHAQNEIVHAVKTPYRSPVKAFDSTRYAEGQRLEYRTQPGNGFPSLDVQLEIARGYVQECTVGDSSSTRPTTSTVYFTPPGGAAPAVSPLKLMQQIERPMPQDGGAFQHLPAELILSVAKHLTDSERKKLEGMSTTVHNALGPTLTSDRLTREAGRVSVLEHPWGLTPQGRESLLPTLTDMLDQTSHLFGSAPSLQVGPLAALAARIPHLPPEQQQEGLDRLLHALQRLPEQYRLEPFKVACANFPMVDRAMRKQMFGKLLQEAASMPAELTARCVPALCSALTTLRGRDGHGQADLRNAYDELMREIGCIEPPPLLAAALATVAQSIPKFDAGLRNTVFDQVFDATKALAPQDQAFPLVALAQSLPHRIAPLGTDLVEEGSAFSRIQSNTFNELRTAIKAVPEAQRGEPLSRLIDSLTVLKNPFLEAMFDDLMVDVHGLPKEHRAPSLAAAARMIPYLPMGTRQIAFDNVLWDVQAIPSGDRGGPLAALGAVLLRLPDDEERKTGYESIMRQVRAIPERKQRADPLEELGRYLSFAYPRDERKDAFDELVTEIRKIPAKDRLLPFVSLSTSIETLPLGERESAFDTMAEQLEDSSWDQGDRLPSDHVDRLALVLANVQLS